MKEGGKTEVGRVKEERMGEHYSHQWLVTFDIVIFYTSIVMGK